MDIVKILHRRFLCGNFSILRNFIFIYINGNHIVYEWSTPSISHTKSVLIYIYILYVNNHTPRNHLYILLFLCWWLKYTIKGSKVLWKYIFTLHVYDLFPDRIQKYILSISCKHCGLSGLKWRKWISSGVLSGTLIVMIFIKS